MNPGDLYVWIYEEAPGFPVAELVLHMCGSKITTLRIKHSGKMVIKCYDNNNHHARFPTYWVNA